MSTEIILIVEDEGIAAIYLESKTQQLGYESAGTAFSGEEAIEMSRRTKPDLILMDIKLGGKMDGIQAGKLIRKELAIPIIYLTALSDEETVARAQENVPLGYLIKPVQESLLKSTIEMAFDKHRLAKHSLDNGGSKGEIRPSEDGTEAKECV